MTFRLCDYLEILTKCRITVKHCKEFLIPFQIEVLEDVMCKQFAIIKGVSTVMRKVTYETGYKALMILYVYSFWSTDKRKGKSLNQRYECI